MSHCKLDGEWQADAVGDLPNSGYEGLEIGVDFGPQPLVFDFIPVGFDFVEVGAVGPQVEKVGVVKQIGEISNLALQQHEYLISTLFDRVSLNKTAKRLV